MKKQFAVIAALARPGAFVRALALAVRIGRRSRKGVLISLAYLVEACLLLLHLEGPCYPTLRTVLVYPHGFVPKSARSPGTGQVAPPPVRRPPDGLNQPLEGPWPLGHRRRAALIAGPVSPLTRHDGGTLC